MAECDVARVEYFVVPAIFTPTFTLPLPLQQIRDADGPPQQISAWIQGRARRLVEVLLEAEVSDVLGRPNYARTNARGSRNGYKLRWLKVGQTKLRMRLPQLRDTDEPFQSCVWRMLKSNCPALDGFILSLYAHGPSAALLRRFIDFVDCGQTQYTPGEPALEQAALTLGQDIQHHRTIDLRRVLPVCLSICTIDARIPGPSPLPAGDSSSDQRFVVCFAKCANAAEEVLSVTDVTADAPQHDEVTIRRIITELRDRGLAPPLLLGGVSSEEIRSCVSSLYPLRQRLGYWDDLFRTGRQRLSSDVMPLALTGYRQLIDT